MKFPHIHWYKTIAKQRIPFKWRIVKRCCCGKEIAYKEPIHIREATRKEREEESEISKLMRWL